MVVLECWGTACRAPNGSTPGCAAGLVRRRRGIAARPRHAWVRGRRARTQRCDLTSTRLSEERDTVRGRRARVQRCDPSREREHHAPDRLAGAAPWQPARTVNRHRRSMHRVLPDVIETRAPDTHVVQSCCTSLLKAGRGGKSRNFYRDQKHVLLST